MRLEGIQESFERIETKRAQLLTLYQILIDEITAQIELSKVVLGISVFPTHTKTLLTQLNGEIQSNIINCLQNSWPVLKTYINGHRYFLNGELIFNMSKVYIDAEYDPKILNRIIQFHFLGEGLFDVFDCFVKEVGDPVIIPERVRYEEIKDIWDHLKEKEFEPALEWISENMDALKNGSDRVLGLQFELHRLKLLQILQNETDIEALAYARTHFPSLYESAPDQMKGLMNCLLYANSLETSPYANLLDPIHLNELGEELYKMFCDCWKLPYRGHLDVSVVAGAEALPTLFEFVDMAEQVGDDWYEDCEVSDPLPLRKEFQHHSIIICQLDAHQCTIENRPVLLECGHVICSDCSIELMMHNEQTLEAAINHFKCPFCRQLTPYGPLELHF